MKSAQLYRYSMCIYILDESKTMQVTPSAPLHLEQDCSVLVLWLTGIFIFSLKLGRREGFTSLSGLIQTQDLASKRTYLHYLALDVAICQCHSAICDYLYLFLSHTDKVEGMHQALSK